MSTADGPHTPTHRCLISEDGVFLTYAKPADVANYPNFVDCTDMDDIEFQRFIAERQAVRPYIVGIGVAS
jgi:hypothetical protein